MNEFPTRQQQKDNAHITAAYAYSNLSYARRKRVGAVIVRDDRIISIGYNGTPSGRDNNCEKEVIDELAYPIDEEPKTLLVSKPEVCHAEMNAIMFAAKHGVSTDGCTVYITMSPCFECAKMLVQCGIKKVVFDEEYRDLSSVDFLRECGLEVEKI